MEDQEVFDKFMEERPELYARWKIYLQWLVIDETIKRAVTHHGCDPRAAEIVRRQMLVEKRKRIVALGDSMGIR